MAYLSGASGRDVDAVAVALEHAQAALPPVVLTELLSDPKVGESVKDLFTPPVAAERGSRTRSLLKRVSPTTCRW